LIFTTKKTGVKTKKAKNIGASFLFCVL